MATTMRPRPAVVLVAVSLQLLLALGFAAIRFAGTAPPLRAVEWPGLLALALVYGLPALLGLLALTGRPAALLAAALLSLPLAFTALSGISLVLLVPGVLYAVGYARWAPRPAPRVTTAALVAAVALLGLAAFAALVVWPADDTVACWSVTVTPDGDRSYGPVELRAQDPSGQRSFGLAQGAAATTVEQGCSSGILELPQAAVSAAVAAAALAAALLLPRRPLPRVPAPHGP